MTTLERRLARLLVAGLTAMAVGGCTEPVQSRPPKTPVDGPLDARLEPSEASPAVGSIVRVVLAVRGTSASEVASFTARIAYDSTQLRYVDEVAVQDGAMRIINPQTGALRVAGIATAGFSDGQLSVVRFSVLHRAGLASLRLTIDEMHTAKNADAKRSLHPSDR